MTLNSKEKRKILIMNNVFYHLIQKKFYRSIINTYNWSHAVNVTEFIPYGLKICQFDERLTKFEHLGLLISSICHDENHMVLQMFLANLIVK